MLFFIHCLCVFLPWFGRLFISIYGHAPWRKFWSDYPEADFQGLDFWLTTPDWIFLPSLPDLDWYNSTPFLLYNICRSSLYQAFSQYSSINKRSLLDLIKIYFNQRGILAWLFLQRVIPLWQVRIMANILFKTL